MVAITVIVTVYLIYTGYGYYITPLEERFYHPDYKWFKPSGVFGHGLGIVGTLMILFGVGIYIARKRYNFMSKYLRLKYLLEFHIFLCVLGPILILFHTAFKFGGLVSIAFWSMVAVVLSGVIGRFIYIQIPRTIEGRELSLDEIINIKTDMINTLQNDFKLDQNIMQMIISSTEDWGESGSGQSLSAKYFNDKKTISKLNRTLKESKYPKEERLSIIKMVKNEIALSRKIAQLGTMQRLFKYWHVAHLPFALIMLIILIVHVAVTLIFGYKWIF
ncbi:MAG: hypothetical protein DRI54_06355 [Bacteroidetes bacterium]|nr:MAG: hypothetical protein DRI54_06355 [Bacteroidota bacterium]